MPGPSKPLRRRRIPSMFSHHRPLLSTPCPTTPSVDQKHGAYNIDPATKLTSSATCHIADGKLWRARTHRARRSHPCPSTPKGSSCGPGCRHHVHFLEPVGQDAQETILTRSRPLAASPAGSPRVCMPNTAPVGRHAGNHELIQQNAARRGARPLLTHGCITAAMKANISSRRTVRSRRAGRRGRSERRRPVRRENQLMRMPSNNARMFRLPVLDHCPTSRADQGRRHELGTVSTRLGLKGWPHAAEDIIVATQHHPFLRQSGAHTICSTSLAMSVGLMLPPRSTSINVHGRGHVRTHIALDRESLGTYDTTS